MSGHCGHNPAREEKNKMIFIVQKKIISKAFGNISKILKVGRPPGHPHNVMVGSSGFWDCFGIFRKIASRQPLLIGHWRCYDCVFVLFEISKSYFKKLWSHIFDNEIRKVFIEGDFFRFRQNSQ